MSESGFVPTGPSELYLKMLKGEITPEEYASKAKKRAESNVNRRVRGTATQRKRA